MFLLPIASTICACFPAALLKMGEASWHTSAGKAENACFSPLRRERSRAAFLVGGWLTDFILFV